MYTHARFNTFYLIRAARSIIFVSTGERNSTKRKKIIEENNFA